MGEPQVYREVSAYKRARNAMGIAHRSTQVSYMSLSPQARRKVRLRLLHQIEKRIRQSGAFAVSSEIREQPNLLTGNIRFSGQARDNLLGHVKSASELNAAQFIWNNPSKLSAPRYSPLGEGKDMTLPKSQRNIQKKTSKGITNFVSYTFKYKGKTWKAKTAQYGRGYETLYYIE